MYVSYIPLVISSLSNLAMNYNEQKFCAFDYSNPVISQVTISDFDNNKFRLYEMNSSYAIYQIDENNEIFIEGSYDINSPFLNSLNNKIYYLGPGNYYKKISENIYENLLTNETFTYDFDKASFQINSETEKYVNADLKRTESFTYSSSSHTEEYSDTYIDENGYTVIKNADYFKRLNQFPNNNDNACGVVSLAIMLT